MSPHLDNLNPEQLQAVQHKDGPILILAGAGSGKTRVLTRRVAHLVLEHHIRPDRILAVTFTNKATKEMRDRLYSLLGDQASRLWVSTFHSAGLKILRFHAAKLGYESGFVVYDDDDSNRLLKRVLQDLSIDDPRYPPSFFDACIDKAKNWYITPEQYQNWSVGKPAEKLLVSEVYENYQRELMRANAMDFGDLLLNVVRLLEQHKEVRELYQTMLQYLLIDEFQDTNEVQYKLVKILSAKSRNILVVGDDDQSIYGFRGANIGNILNFEHDFPEAKVIKLEQNYRSTNNVLTAANSVIVKNKGRKGKKLWSEAESGELIRTFVGYDEEDEARFVRDQIQSFRTNGTKLNDIAIFYRTNAQSRALEEALLSAKIPYRIYGAMRFYERKEIKDIVAYLRLIANPKDNEALLRVINNPARGIGAQAQVKLIQESSNLNLSLFETCERLVAGEFGRSGKASKGICAFVSLMNSLKSFALKASLPELISSVVDQSGYAEKLRSSKDPESESRLENIAELIVVATVFGEEELSSIERLRAFLDRVSLTGGDEVTTAEAKDLSIEHPEAEKPEFVSLMTLHLAKGLEFDVVFFTGFEEGFLPHQRSLANPEDIEEERRLCYVGITRAKKILYLTRTTVRGMASAASSFGASGRWRSVSQFGQDIPESLIQSYGGDFFGGGSWSDPNLEMDEAEVRPESYELDQTDSSNWFSRKKKKQKKFESYGDLLLESPIVSAEEIDAPFEPADPKDLQVGIQVQHTVFGKGVITALEGSGAQKKALIVFEGFENEKKVMLKHGKLALLR